MKINKAKIGTWITTYNTSALDVISKCNFDWICIDMEHSSITLDQLQNLLNVLDKLAVKKEKDALGDFGGIRIEGTLPGFDKNTQFTTIIEEGEGMIWFLREVNGSISLRVPVTSSATIETISDGKENLIIVGDGESVNIIIRQDS